MHLFCMITWLGIEHDYVTDHVVCRHNFILETICGAVNIRNSHCPTLRKPVALSFWTITRLRHNWVLIPRTLSFWGAAFYSQLVYFPWRNSPPLSSHYNSRAQSLLRKYSQTISKLVLAKFPHRLGGNIQRLLRLQNCHSRKSPISRKYSKTSSPAKLS